MKPPVVPSTTTSFTVSLYVVFPSFSVGVVPSQTAALGGLPPHPTAVPTRWLIGSTSDLVPNIFFFFVSMPSEPNDSSALRALAPKGSNWNEVAVLHRFP
jgi:hypothetical protein